MNKHLLVVTDGLVAFCWVLPTTMVEEARADWLSDLRVVFDAKKQTPDEDDEVTRARERALCYYIRQTLTKKWYLQ